MIIKIYKDNKWIDFDIKKLEPITFGKKKKFLYDSKKISARCKVKFICKTCNRENIFSNFDLKNIDTFNYICGSCSRKDFNLRNYGVENQSQRNEIKEKKKLTQLRNYGTINGFDIESVKKTMKERYGVEHASQSIELQKKAQETIRNKRNGLHTFQTDDFKRKTAQTKFIKYNNEKYVNIEKSKQTCLNKYGVDNPTKSPIIVKNIIRNNNLKYGVDWPNQLDINKTNMKEIRLTKSYKQIITNKTLLNKVKPLFDLNDYIKKQNKYDKFTWLCTKCGQEFECYIANGKIPLCTYCYPREQSSSLLEKEVANFIKSLNIEIIENDKSILNPYELDIYIPSHNLAIEFNGLYWHSELNGKDKNYHLNKTLGCKNKGIQLIHIFEDEWLNKKEIIKSIIKIKLGLIERRIYGRKCVIKEVDNQKEFLDVNHVQGYIQSKVNIGLYYENELVSLLTFGKSRYNKKYDWEILRYANKLNTSVIGGFTKLLKYFLNHYDGSIITYSDIRLFDGSIYRNNGFNELDTSNTAYFYVKGLMRYNRQQFQKHKLKNKLEVFDPDLTEWQNMQMNGWDRIWDCGNYIFEMRK